MSGAGEVGRRQPAQRPTIAQDGAFLNKPITAMCQRVLDAGWRPQPVHTCCPTDWPVCGRPSRVDAQFAEENSPVTARPSPCSAPRGLAGRDDPSLDALHRRPAQQFLV